LEDVRGDTVREGNSYVPLRVITEQIRVRDDQPRTIRIRSSRHGPLLSDVDQRLQEVSASKSDPSVAPYGVSLSWTALQPVTPWTRCSRSIRHRTSRSFERQRHS
jgi:penicillin amidase